MIPAPLRSESGAEANRRVAEIVDRALFVPKQGTPITQCPSNIDLNTFHGKALLMKAGSPAELDIKGDQPLFMSAVAFVMFPDQQTDEETGETSEFVRLVLFDADGKHFRTSSVSGPFRLRTMLELFTPKEWTEGIPLVIKARVGKRGRTYHDINIDTSKRYGI